MNIPDEAVEAAARVMAPAAWGPRVWQFVAHGEAPTDARNRVQQQALQEARTALEAAAPIMLSHELEQTRLAHLDAVVNAQTGDALENGAADAWEAGMRHALAWLGLRHYGDVMAKDNPHGKAEG